MLSRMSRGFCRVFVTGSVKGSSGNCIGEEESLVSTVLRLMNHPPHGGGSSLCGCHLGLGRADAALCLITNPNWLVLPVKAEVQ